MLSEAAELILPILYAIATDIFSTNACTFLPPRKRLNGRSVLTSEKVSSDRILRFTR